MKTNFDLLSHVSVASPCSADWNEMAGDDRVRFCGHCSKNVYNLSSLTEREASDLIHEHEGNLCGRFYRRKDGTMLTADCPVGVHHRLRRKRRLATLAVSLSAFLTINGCSRFDDAGTSTSPAEPTVRQEKLPMPRVVDDKPMKDCIMGKLEIRRDFDPKPGQPATQR